MKSSVYPVMRRSFKPLLIIAVCAGVYAAAPDLMSESCRRSAAIFVFAALSWAFEIFPLYATTITALTLAVSFFAILVLLFGYKFMMPIVLN